MTLTKPYEATFEIGTNEKKAFSFLFDEVSEHFIKVLVKRVDGTIYTPVFSVDMELKQVVFGEDEITPTTDDIICIYRQTPTIQDTPFNTLQGYNAKSLENILSKIVAMIQEMKANGFSTQVLQGFPWSLDLIHPADDGASVQIDYQARVLKKGLYFKMSDGNLQASADGVNYVTMPKSENVKEFKHSVDTDGNVHFQYMVDGKWYGLGTSAEIGNVYTKSEIDNKVMVINAEIDGNVDAIHKTRDDFTAADSVLRKDIDDNKSDIAKLRDDMNTSDSALQGQITVNATAIAKKQEKLIAGDNIVIGSDGKTISATGAGGGAGLSFIVYDTLPETGESGIIYLVPKDSEAPDVYNEYVWITATQTFELIGSTQVDLSGYLPLSGGTMTGDLNFDNKSIYLTGIAGSVGASKSRLVLGTPDAEYAFLTGNSSGAFGVYSEKSGTRKGITCYPGTSFFADTTTKTMDIGRNDKIWKTGYIDKISDGTELVYTKDIATKEYVDTAVSNIDALPDQTGNAGKVLTTDGTTASWQDPAGGTKVIFREWEE